MIDSFYTYGLLFILVSLFFVLLPFVRKEKQVERNPNANALRIADFESRMIELEQEVASGKLTKEAFNTAVIEQKRRLMNDFSPEKKLNFKANRMVIALTASLFMITFCGIFYSMTGSFGLLVQWQEARDNLPELGKRAVLQQGEPLSNNDLQQFALGLRTKLAEQGDDEMAWLLLGRVMMSLNDFESANSAFDKVIALNSSNSSALLSKAQLLMLKGDESSINQAAQAISIVLKVEPTNIDAISLLALIAYEKGDWEQSLAAFELIISQIQPSDANYSVLAARINELKANIAKKSRDNTDNVQDQSLAVEVQISLADPLIDSVPENGVLFVFAKAENGPPMPLAVAKKSQWTLPLTVTLSEDNAMVEGLSFSQFKQIVVIARVSTDDKVDIQSGEIEGRSHSFNVQTTDVINLIIDTKL
jgi:cytochrome c-type biogenesis protein CcmI